MFRATLGIPASQPEPAGLCSVVQANLHSSACYLRVHGPSKHFLIVWLLTFPLFWLSLRAMEGELEVVWESTSKENQRIRELLRATLERTGVWTSARASEDPRLEGLAQGDVLDGCSLSYCDMKPPPSPCQGLQEPLG